MILTLTANPLIDRLARLNMELKRGGVFRLPMAEDMADGKGVNVSKALHYAGEKMLAFYPASDPGKFMRLLEVSGILHKATNTTNKARANLTLAEPDGTTTKLNSPGMTLTKVHRRRVLEKLVHHAKRVTWVVFVGLLPSGVPRDFYVQYTEVVYSVNPNIHVVLDTGDGPLTEVAHAFPKVRPFLMKPSAYELDQTIDQDGEVLEAAVAEGNYLPVMQVARALNELGVPEVPATLGEARVVLSMKSGDCFVATSPSIVTQPTVGAGDCASADYVISCECGDSYQDALTTAVVYGAAATSLPGTTTPYPEQVYPETGRLRQLDA